METVAQELKDWGEIIVTTAAGETYELHVGDTRFDAKTRLITLDTPNAQYVIDGDAVENVKKHYGHRVEDE